MKFDSKGLKERLVPNLEKGVNMAEKCDELIQDIARNASDVQISFNGSKCTTLIEEAKKHTNDICIATKVTVSMFDSAEKANMEIIDRLYSLDGDYFEEIFGTEDKYYGTDQGIFTYLFLYDYSTGEDEKTIKEVAATYNMTYEDAAKACTILDSIGACSYAAAANTILTAYRYDPAAFEEDFGYPMFDVNEKGELVVNGDRLLMDMYIYYNSEENGGKIFKKVSDGKLEVNDEYIELADEETNRYRLNSRDYQIYLNNTLTRKDDETIGISVSGYEFLKSKNSSKNIEVESVICGSENRWNDLDNDPNVPDEEKNKIHSVKTKEELKKELQKNINGNHIICMNIGQSEEIIYHRKNDDDINTGNGGHAVYVTGVTDEGIIVSTWGYECLITYDDLIECQSYEIFVYSVEDK